MTPRGPVFPAPRPSWTLENSTFTGPCLIRLPSWPEIPNSKSPIVNPNLESGTWRDSRPKIVQESFQISRLFAFSSKPGSCPEPQDSPTIHARQKIFSRKQGRGYSTEHLATRKWSNQLFPPIKRQARLSFRDQNLGNLAERA
jgi:hypothetical protein